MDFFNKYCKKIKKNGKKCDRKYVYKGYCISHGKHLLDKISDPYKLLKNKKYNTYEIVKSNRIDVNYVKDGKTVIHRLITDGINVHLHCYIVGVGGQFDAEKPSIDTFTVDGVTYVDTKISPFIYLIYASTMPIEKRRSAIESMSLYIKNIDQSFNGEHILVRALNVGFDDIIDRCVDELDPLFLEKVRDKKGNSIIVSCIKRKDYGSLDRCRCLERLFNHKTLANIKDEKGNTPAATMLKTDKNLITDYKNRNLLGLSDFSICDNNGVSVLEMPEYKSIHFKNLYGSINPQNIHDDRYVYFKNVYKYIKDVKEEYRQLVQPKLVFMPAPTGEYEQSIKEIQEYDRDKHINENIKTARIAIKSLLDIIFTLKLITKRRAKGLCNLVGNKIIDYLIPLYDR